MFRPAVIFCALMGCSLAMAQAPSVTRALRRFDFEERRFNVEELPVDWQKIEGAGLPHYVNGRLSRNLPRNGQYSFQLDLNGGSLMYRYPAGKIAVRPDAHYRVEAWARTTVLQHARARITAYFADIDGRPLTQTIRHSDPWAATRPDEPWRRLSVELTASDPAAAFLVLEIGAVQPSIYRPGTLGDRALFMQDIRGTVWFDDVAVSQVPRVTLSTDQLGNIFPAGIPLVANVQINDRFTDDLAAHLVIRNADGAMVYQNSGSLDLNAGREVREGVKDITVPLPDLPAGWYQVVVAMSSQGESLGEQQMAIVRLADRGLPVPPDRRFGVIATGLPFRAWNQLPDVLPMLGAGRVKLAVWSPAGDVLEAPDVRFDDLLEELTRRRITPTACLIGLPPSVAAKVRGTRWVDLLKAPRDSWQPRLAYVVARHANHLDRWQLGEDGVEGFVSDDSLRTVYNLIHAEFKQLIQNPDLAMPWPASYELDGNLPSTVALSLPASVLPAQVPLYVQQQIGSGSMSAQTTLSISLQLLDRAKYGRETQIRDFAQRYAYAAASGAQRVDVPIPFDARTVDQRTVLEPQELFMVLRTLNMLLGNSIFRGKVPIADNIDAFLFDREGQGILMLWSKGNESGVKDLAINLGQRPMRVDLWGNVTPLLAGGRGGQPARIQIGPTPIFLVDIDGEMARLRTSVAWDNDKIESSFKPHVRKLRFTNPYPAAISGMIRLRGPSGWTLSPPSQSFMLNPGETFSRDVTIEFPYNTFAGSKEVTVEFSLQGVTDTAFSVPAPLQLGLSDVGLQTIALRDGEDVLVQQMITNYGDKPIDYSAFAIFPGQARQERLVTGLGPGRTTIKKYRFSGVTIGESARVRSGIKELNGTRILNDEVEVR